MQLNIRQRYKPFTHEYGKTFPLPGTTLACTIYPTLIEFYDLSDYLTNRLCVVELQINGPLKEFTATLDLEKGDIKVFGKDQKGFFRYIINDTGIHIEKGAIKASTFEMEKIAKTLPQSRLNLGVNKKQDLSQMHIRKDLKELLPHLFALSQWYKDIPAKDFEIAAFDELIHIAFNDTLTPQSIDPLFQGYPNLPLPKGTPPIQLFPNIYHKILSTFVDYNDKTLTLRTPFVSGKLGGVDFDTFTLDFEWTKKFPRRLFICTKEETTLKLSLPKPIKSFRFNKKKHSANETITLEKNTRYLIDRFEK